MASPYIERETRLSHLAEALGLALKIDDPHSRSAAYGLRGGGPVSPREDRAARARFDLRRRVLACATTAAEAASFGLLIAVWAVVYCLLCPPAQAATAMSEHLETLAPWAPFIIAGLVLLCGIWALPTAERLDRPDYVVIDEDPAIEAPPTAPALSSLEDSFRHAERG